jgi:hypothetical protein
MANYPLRNGSNTPLNANSGTVPDMSTTLQGWFQQLQFELITKSVEGFQNYETSVTVNTRGVIQPFSDRQLLLKPEGQRAWSWYWLHAEVALNNVLKVDDILTYSGRNYRVMSKRNYSLYGFIEYHLITDWTGSDPTPAGGP